MSLPHTFSECFARYAAVFGNTASAEAECKAWLDEACEAAWGAPLHAVSRQRRQTAMQRLSGIVLALEDQPGDFAFVIGMRRIVAELFARYWMGLKLEGPPWRLDPTEKERPMYNDLIQSADFGAAV